MSDEEMVDAGNVLEALPAAIRDIKVGRLEEMPVRQVWPLEERHLTAGLAANLDVLEAELGLRLEVVEQKHRVGRYELDLFLYEWVWSRSRDHGRPFRQYFESRSVILFLTSPRPMLQDSGGWPGCGSWRDKGLSLIDRADMDLFGFSWLGGNFPVEKRVIRFCRLWTGQREPKQGAPLSQATTL